MSGRWSFFRRVVDALCSNRRPGSPTLSGGCWRNFELDDGIQQDENNCVNEQNVSIASELDKPLPKKDISQDGGSLEDEKEGGRPTEEGVSSSGKSGPSSEACVDKQNIFVGLHITQVQSSPAPRHTKSTSLEVKRAPAPPYSSLVLDDEVSVHTVRTHVKRRKAPAPLKPTGEGRLKVGDGETSAGDIPSFPDPDSVMGDGSFLGRIPPTMVEVTSSPTVITEGPHKLIQGTITEGPQKPSLATTTGGPQKPATVTPPAPGLSIPDGALIGLPKTAPGTKPDDKSEDDAGSSDADSGTADVMGDLPTPATEEEEEEEGEEEEEDDREDQQHRVVISVTQIPSEIHGPLGCQEVPPVVVRLQPGDQGRYGFNVKGGAGSSIPVTVSKVAPRSATRCQGPRLSEGDQVILINGQDVTNFTHREVVRFIKSCRDRQCELELTVKPNLNYEGPDDLEEPLVRYVPDTGPLSLAGPDAPAATLALAPDASPLSRSIAELAHALSRGLAQVEFDSLARRELNLTMDDCRLPCNIAKNRYRDISPYDSTRVFLRSAESGDYINANFVTMEIPGSGVVNRYIAAQGPLHNTAGDFWAMIWEQQCPLVVMLTTLVEQGRVKCHQYWPELGRSELFGDVRVITVTEEVTESFAFREITLVSQKTGEERHLSHMQYVSWPDHGVPDQPADFVQFVRRVRSARTGLSEPTAVHCSAGIGRTGVLILMETAMCLIEANQPVYPLELVRCMRRQRAMMIQTTSQFEFVCEAVVQAHQDGSVQPLPEFSRRD